MGMCGWWEMVGMVLFVSGKVERGAMMEGKGHGDPGILCTPLTYVHE